MKMTRKEKITKILDKYWIRRGWIESDESMVEARPLTAKEELADAIMAIAIEVPSEEEIEKKYSGSPNNHIHPNRYRKEGAKWMRNEILKRNGKDK
jgi:hypothetical protein